MSLSSFDTPINVLELAPHFTAVSTTEDEGCTGSHFTIAAHATQDEVARGQACVITPYGDFMMFVL